MPIIAQAILGKPQFILLDEPTTGLDIEERCHFYQIFHQLEGVCPVLVSSHITEDIVEGCTNTIILKTGTILLQEKTEKIKPSLEEVYLQCMRGIKRKSKSRICQFFIPLFLSLRSYFGTI